MSDRPKNKDLTEFITIVGVLFIIFCIWASYPRILKVMDEPAPPPKVIIPYKLPTEPEQTQKSDKTKFENVGEKYGTYGDSYGSLNTLFSGLAFAVLIISMFMQRQELREQRKELAQQREELAAQRKEAEQSNKIAEEQRKINKQQGDLITQQIEIAQVQNFYTIFFKQLDTVEADFNRLFPKGAAMQNNVLDHHKNAFFDCIYHFDNNILEQSTINLHLLAKFRETSDHIHFHHSLFIKSLLQVFKFIDENKNIANLDVKQPINNLLTRLDDNTLLTLTWLAIAENEELLHYLEEFSMLRTLSNLDNKKVLEFLQIYFSEKAFQEPVGTHST